LGDILNRALVEHGFETLLMARQILAFQFCQHLPEFVHGLNGGIRLLGLDRIGALIRLHVPDNPAGRVPAFIALIVDAPLQSIPHARLTGIAVFSRYLLFSDSLPLVQRIVDHRSSRRQKKTPRHGKIDPDTCR
jgi:hypothetical protein